MTTIRPTRVTAARKAVSLLCLALFLALQVLAVAPGLHRHLHPDANQPDHQCAITLLSQGNLDAPALSLIAIDAPSTFFFIAPAPCAFAPVAGDHQFPPGRAPPAFLLG